MWTIPNIITMFRVLLIPVFVLVYFLDWRWAHQAGAFIFWFAAITDWFDGYLARRLKQSTPFGAFLDPVADRLERMGLSRSLATAVITFGAVLIFVLLALLVIWVAGR